MDNAEKIIVFVITFITICYQNSSCAYVDLKVNPAMIRAGDSLTINCTGIVSTGEQANYIILLKDDVKFYNMSANQSSASINYINGISNVEPSRNVGQVTIRNANTATAGTYKCIFNYRVRATNQFGNVSTISNVYFANTIVVSSGSPWTRLLLTPGKFKKNENTFVNCTYGYPNGYSFVSLTLSKDGKNFTIFTNTSTNTKQDPPHLVINSIGQYIGQETISADTSGVYRCQLDYRDNLGRYGTAISVYFNASNNIRPVWSLFLTGLFLLLAKVI